MKIPTHTGLGEVMTQTRAQTDSLFRLIRPEAWYERPVPMRHRLIFYLGHLEAFDLNLFGQERAIPSLHPEFDQLFAFGIDPDSGQLPQDERSDWPELPEVERYTGCTRRMVDEVCYQLSQRVLSMAVEHRLMHAETFTYLLHHLTLDQKTIARVPALTPTPPPVHSMIDIPEGRVTLGQFREPSDDQHSFGWDNEFDGHEVFVDGFAMGKYKVTNAEYLEFVRAGAKPPHFWTWHEGQWYWRGMTGETPLPLNWPVYVTHEEATAFAAWTGRRLPTEAEFHRAAYRTMHGEEERAYPWGDEEPDGVRGNFGGHRWDPISVTGSPLGDSAFGISQLVGNGWEWTSTLFQPFPGFEPFAFYPGYSAPFFDDNHYVLKGASSRTDVTLLRRSFRNWYRPNFPYVYAGFRCVED